MESFYMEFECFHIIANQLFILMEWYKSFPVKEIQLER